MRTADHSSGPTPRRPTTPDGDAARGVMAAIPPGRGTGTETRPGEVICVLWHPRESLPDPVLLSSLRRKGVRITAATSALQALALACAAGRASRPRGVVLLLDRPNRLREVERCLQAADRYAPGVLAWRYDPRASPMLSAMVRGRANQPPETVSAGSTADVAVAGPPHVTVRTAPPEEAPRRPASVPGQNAESPRLRLTHSESPRNPVAMRNGSTEGTHAALTRPSNGVERAETSPVIVPGDPKLRLRADPEGVARLGVDDDGEPAAEALTVDELSMLLGEVPSVVRSPYVPSNRGRG